MLIFLLVYAAVLVVSLLVLPFPSYFQLIFPLFTLFLLSAYVGMAIGIVGDAGVRAVGQQDKIFVGMILILIFAEALGTS